MMTDTIREDFWKALSKSPFVLIGLESDKGHSVPMTAQLDKDADSAFWFYTQKTNRLAPGGPAVAHFSGKGHELFACITGALVEETDPAVIDRYWSNQVAAWFQGGRADPNLMMLRFDLDGAEIWEADLGLVGTFKLMTGLTIRAGEAGSHAEVAL